MLAAVYHGPQDVRVEQVPVPEAGPGEVLLKVNQASICGTDLRILSGGHRKYPAGTIRIPGHEMVGTVSQVGQGVAGIQPGQRMFVAPNMGCGGCRQCTSGNNNQCANYAAIGITMDGAFAEYVRLPAQAVVQGNLMPVADDIDPAAAALIEPFACVLRGQNALNIRPGDTVLVIGAGPIGILHMKLAHLRGAGKVIMSEMNSLRLERALQMGADRIVNPENENLEAVVLAETRGQGADVVIVAAPSRTGQEDALNLAGIGGRVNYFGGLSKGQSTIRFDSNIVHYKELVVTGTSGCSTFDCRQAAEIVNSGRVDLSDLISARLPLREAVHAFELARDRQSYKVVLEP